MPIATVSLSTSGVPGPSAPVGCNWRGGRPVLTQLTVSSSVATGTFSIQWTGNDIQLADSAGSSVYPPTGSVTAPTLPIWTGLSSSPWFNSIGAAETVYTASTIFPDGVSYTFWAPPAAIRIYSSALSSCVLTLSVTQGDGG